MEVPSNPSTVIPAPTWWNGPLLENYSLFKVAEILVRVESSSVPRSFTMMPRLNGWCGCILTAVAMGKQRLVLRQVPVFVESITTCEIHRNISCLSNFTWTDLVGLGDHFSPWASSRVIWVFSKMTTGLPIFYQKMWVYLCEPRDAHCMSRWGSRF
jgi:hypothetical protein